MTQIKMTLGYCQPLSNTKNVMLNTLNRGMQGTSESELSYDMQGAECIIALTVQEAAVLYAHTFRWWKLNIKPCHTF